MKTTKWISVLTGTLMLFTVSNAHAVGPVFEMGVYFGGDELVSATFVSGETETIDAGGFLDFAGGVTFPLSSQWQGRVTLGYRFDDIDASNGSIEWERLALEAKAFYKQEFWYLGGGLTYHLDPELTVLSTPFEFDDSLGLVLEADYVLPTGLYFGGKFTIIDYEYQGASVDGNSLGFVVGWQFE